MQLLSPHVQKFSPNFRAFPGHSVKAPLYVGSALGGVFCHSDHLSLVLSFIYLIDFLNPRLTQRMPHLASCCSSFTQTTWLAAIFPVDPFLITQVNQATSASLILKAAKSLNFQLFSGHRRLHEVPLKNRHATSYLIDKDCHAE